MELSAGLMSAVDLCICTGGPSMVKAAYSAAKPAIGVRWGQRQVMIDRDVDLKGSGRKWSSPAAPSITAFCAPASRT